MIDIKGKNALVTGSSRGIGQQIALGLAEKGCNIIVHGRSEESCSNTLQLLKKYAVTIYVVHGDLAETSELNSLIDQVRNLRINVDILYNNAAIMRPYREDIWSHTAEDWMETFKVNIVAMYQLSAAFIPDMIKNNFGRVVNTTSGIMNTPQLAPYGASKKAVDKLSQDLAYAVQNTAVRINYLDPGWLRTDMGGENAFYSVESVLPGALVPILIEDNGPNGEFFCAVDYHEN